jgi:endonuclease YncB( thermonuclease family)
MAKALTKTSGYKALVKKVVQEFEELEIFVKNRVAKGHWNVGKYIDEHLLENKDRAEYGTGFYEEFAEDTGRDRTTLQRTVAFYRAYPIRAETHELAWEHYKGLITVKDVKERKKLEQEIIRNRWGTKKFRKYLSVKRKLAAPAEDDKPVPQLKFTRGKLHTYQIVPANKTLAHRDRGPLALDLGFREQYEIPKGAPKLKENDTVELVFSTRGGSASGGREGTFSGAVKVSVAKEELFTYVAMVERVIDGDTLLVSFDFNCPMSVSQKLRLRGINCPEMDTEEGKRAKRFVEARLKDCEFIIVKTYKDRTDKFDRYLADIFCLPGANDPVIVASEGTYLNQELLNEHLAVAYE